MAQIPPPTGKKPIPKPAGNPYANIQVAPRAAPKANLVRPTGPVAAPPKPMSGSPSSMGLNPSYTSSNPVNANDRGGDRIQKMPREMMFDPQIQYNLLTKPLAAKYGLEGPASLLNPENYSYNNLQDGISKFGNTLGNVTNLMAYGTPVGAAFAGAGQAANTAGALGNTTPGNALAGAGGAAMVTFAVKNILGRGSAAGMAGQTILELTKLAGAFGKSEIVNAVKNLTGADISGYIDTAFNADILTSQIPSLGIQKPDTQLNIAGNYTLLPSASGPGSRIFKNTEGVKPDYEENTGAVYPQTVESLKDENAKQVVEQFNVLTQRKIIARALELAREGKLDYGHAKTYSQALVGIDMATNQPANYPDGYPWVNPNTIMLLQSAINNGKSEADIRQILNRILYNSTPYNLGEGGMIPYDQGLVDEVSRRYGPEQMDDLGTILARIAQDQQYPLGINMQYNEAINALRIGRIGNVFGVPNLSQFNTSPIYRPDQIGALQSRRLGHERLVLPGEFPSDYGVEQAKLNPEGHPIYGYHQKPETPDTEIQLEGENARAFGPATFTISDAKKADSFTSTGDSTWSRNFLRYGNFDLEDIVTSMRPNTVEPYSIPREGQDPRLWSPDSFPGSWGEAQIMGGINLDDITGATLRYSPGNSQIPAELRRMLDARGIPYQTQEWNSPMGSWWQ